jgi:dTDP-4-dehydrorhamnose reductase
VTLWSAFGACDWDSLVTLPRGHYEPGAFDVRGLAPRPTPLAAVAAELARTGRCTHPLAVSPGWWRREERALYTCE